jgi:Heparinase II/III-like protein
MPLLLDAERLAQRAAAAAGLAPLADSLAADLERVLAARIVVPREKALLSRAGGYCERDGTALLFDPWSPKTHRCPRCEQVHRGELHDRWWLYPYQLWLAERAVHAATLFALRGDTRHGEFAADILGQYAAAYLEYPNRDNVLGPTRPFFSTYLESIWLLQLCVALDLLETAGHPVDGQAIRESLVEPSVALIAEYNEGASNRQVWNNAALLAGHLVLGDDHAVEPIVLGPSGLLAHLEDGLLDDGTWYEGENYHQFAHRGLWYGVQLAERAGLSLPRAAVQRFESGFAATFATALPDLTLPSRKDSQYATSVRQWRFAELCELGLARCGAPALAAMLAKLYDDDAPAGETGRAVSSAEVERNLPAVRITRADLGWKSLLFAREQLPVGAPADLSSVLLAGQGIAVFRRDHDRVYVALDYGQSGGGHGHPDRLNVLFSTGAARWLDDLGTGSYVDPSLHWYRSTLAHNAPMADGHSQWRVDGVLQAFDEQGEIAWVNASAFVWPDVIVQRTIVVMPEYFIDRVRWRAGHAAALMLPVHCDAELSGQIKATRARYSGAGGLEDGDAFVTTERAYKAAAGARVHLVARDPRTGEEIRGFTYCRSRSIWYTLSGPGQPPTRRRRFHLVEAEREPVGELCTLWAWSPDVESVEWTADTVGVNLRNGGRHVHSSDQEGWHVEITDRSGFRQVVLAGTVEPDVHDATPEPDEAPDDGPGAEPHVTSEEQAPGYNGLLLLPSKLQAAWWSDATPEERMRYAVYHLGEPTYRRSEERWEEAGKPTARVAIAASTKALTVDVQVTTLWPRFVLANAVNPYDNEPADINGDGVQLYVRTADDGGAWVLVPDPDAKAGVVRPRAIDGWGSLKLGRTAWRRTREGYELRVEIPMREPLQVGSDLGLDLLVNETAPGRERRSGQLILSGPDGEFVYLRGDRHDPARLLHFTVVT